MSLALQAKLLRALQEREIRRVGGTAPIRVDVRILAATNQPLEQKVKQGLFREDLYYRLCVVKVTLPSLRERGEDIPFLADYFLKKYCAEANKTVLAIGPQAMDLLCRYSWPGNVRELEHAIEQAVVLTTNTVILPEDLPEPVRHPSRQKEELPPFELMSLNELHRRYLTRVLEATRGNKSEAARILGIDRRTLYRMAMRFRLSLTGEDLKPTEGPSSET